MKVPLPFLFNCLKHHQNFILEKISDYSQKIDFEFVDLEFELKQIGTTQMDLYTGNYQPSQITTEIKLVLLDLQAFEFHQYNQFIANSNGKYQLVEISDKSKWTLLCGNDKEHYIHIHPAKYSPLSIRIRANTLRTCIALLVYTQKYGGDPFNIELVNQVRKEWLNESPVKHLKENQGYTKLLNLFLTSLHS